MTHKPIPAGINVAQTFLVYMALVGDAEKTALACGIAPEVVSALAEREGWSETVRRISLVSKGSPADWERSQNRALNFVQVHQLRRRLDAEIAHLCEMKPGEAMITCDKHGNTRLSARVYTDLAAAMERIHILSYEALGDTTRERLDRIERGDGLDPVSQGGVHAAAIAALNKSKDTPVDTLANEAQAVVNDLTKELKSANPVVPQ